VRTLSTLPGICFTRHCANPTDAAILPFSGELLCSALISTKMGRANWHLRIFTTACKNNTTWMSSCWLNTKGIDGRIPNAIRLLLLLLMVGNLVGVTPATSATFSTVLERDTITLGESTTLSLTFQGTAQQSPPALPALQNLQVAYVGPSSQVSIVNGQVSSTISHVFSLTPSQAGDFMIPSMTVEIGGEKLTSQPLKLKVLKPGAPSQEAIQAGNQPAFLKLALPKKEIYVGEVITAELQLHVRSGIQNIDQFQTTSFPTDGFNASKLTQGRQRQVQIGNVSYLVVPLGFTLKAIKTGTFTLGPVTASVVAELPGRNRRRDSVFDMLDMFGGGERRQVMLATEPEQVQILPLPSQGVPPGFAGAVGNYSMSFSAGPTNVAVGDPITLKIQISGRGALDSLAIPEPNWRDFKAYPPSSKVETSDPFGIQGTKSFEQVFAPQNTDVKELPAFNFAYFDPEQKTYKTLTQPAVKLVVRPSGSTPAPTIAATRRDPETAPESRDIVHIKPRPGTLAQGPALLLMQPLFLGAQTVPVMVLLAAVILRKRREHLANNPRILRQRQVAAILRDGQAQLRGHAEANSSDEFFAALFRLLQEQLGERLDLPASAITEAVIEERLLPRGISSDLSTRIHELFQMCNQARYAPVKSSQELSALIPKWESVSRELQNFRA
jgi:hypothetical protein